MIQDNPRFYDQISLWEALSIVSQKWSFPTALTRSISLRKRAQQVAESGSWLRLELPRLEGRGCHRKCSADRSSSSDPLLVENWLHTAARQTSAAVLETLKHGTLLGQVASP